MGGEYKQSADTVAFEITGVVKPAFRVERIRYGFAAFGIAQVLGSFGFLRELILSGQPVIRIYVVVVWVVEP